MSDSRRADKATSVNGTAPVRRSRDPELGTTHFARRMVVAILIALLILAIALVLWHGVHVLLEAFAGLLFALFLNAISDAVHRHTRLSYRWSLAVVVLGLFAIVGGLGYLLGSHLSTQIGELLKTLPRSLQQIRAYLMQYSWGQYLIENAPSAATNLAEGNSFSKVTGFISSLAGFLEAALVILIVGIFGAAEPGLYKQGLLHLIPPQHRRRTTEAVDAIALNLRHWLVGQVQLMVIIALTTMVGLWLIGIPLALTLGIMAGVLEIVPYIGAILSALPALMIALLKGPEYALYAALVYLGIHVLDGYVLGPLIQRRAVHLPPALTIVTQVLMGELLGFLGLFVAAPLTVAAMVLLKMLYVEDTLGDEAVNVPGEPGNEAKQAQQSGQS